MPRVAALDCGTHSLRLLVADVDLEAGTLTDIERDMIIVRLGQGVDRTGRLSDEALTRAFATTDDYAARCRRLGVERLRFVATSATRDASNRQVFVEGIEDRLGITPEIISGEEEALLAFRGATAGLDPGHPSPYLVVDIGGGSTEFVIGSDSPEATFSADIGCVRMTERHLRSDPPSEDEVAAATADIHAALDRVADEVGIGKARTLIGLAGSVTTVTAHALGLESYRPEAIHGSTIPIDFACEAASDLLARTQESRAALGYMHPGRIDVIGGGALVWREIMRRVQRETALAGAPLDVVVTSEHDILDGIAWTLADSGTPR
jgi:exopolyphosphatase/guanosine-5'-triphosphate,3'-diphosphate pyrophosphatase